MMKTSDAAKEYHKQWRLLNKEKIKLTGKEYRDKTVEKRKKYHKEYYKKNKEIFKELSREYRIKNKEKIQECNKEYVKRNAEKIKIKQKIYRENNRDSLNLYFKNRRKEDILFRISGNLRSRIRIFLKTGCIKKVNGLSELLGCSYEDLVTHLSKKFSDGMNLENYGEWHIDHIKPLCNAKDENDLKRLCHYTNLQPLWAIDNLRKNKY